MGIGQSVVGAGGKALEAVDTALLGGQGIDGDEKGTEMGDAAIVPVGIHLFTSDAGGDSERVGFGLPGSRNKKLVPNTQTGLRYKG